MAETYTNIVKWITAPFAHSLSGGQDAVEYLSRNRVLRIRQDIADAAATDTWTRHIMIADKAVNITAISIIPDATVTANDTNYFTMSFATGTVGAMTSRDSISAKITAGTGDWAVAVPEAFTVVTSTDSLAAGELLTYSKAEEGSGLAVPPHTLEVHYNYV